MSIDFSKSSWIILSQARTLDRIKFVRQIGTVSPQEFYIIKQKIAMMYGYSYGSPSREGEHFS